MNSRGVSALVGFILIFAIIMTGATIAIMVGEDQISDVRTHEQTVNAERAMVLVGQSLNDLGQANSASTVRTVHLNDGSLRHTDEENVSITVTNGGGDSWRWSAKPTGSIAYLLDDAVIRYENGLLLRSDRDSGVGLVEPRLSCTDDRAMLTVVTLNRIGPSEQVGSGRMDVVGYRNETRLLYPLNRSGVGSAGDGTSVSLEINSTQPDVWDTALTDHDDWNWAKSGGEVECDVGTDGRVYVRQTVIDVRLER